MKFELVPFGVVVGLEPDKLYVGVTSPGGFLNYVDFSARSPSMQRTVPGDWETTIGGAVLCADGVPVEAPCFMGNQGAVLPSTTG